MNVGYAAPATDVILENTLPVVDITSLASHTVLHGASIQITGTASDSSGLAFVWLTIQRDSDGAYWDGSTFTTDYVTQLGTTGMDSWSYDWWFDPAEQGGTPSYTVRAYAWDANYNEGASPAVSDVTVKNVVTIQASSSANGTITPGGDVVVPWAMASSSTSSPIRTTTWPPWAIKRFARGDHGDRIRVHRRH